MSTPSKVVVFLSPSELHYQIDHLMLISLIKKGLMGLDIRFGDIVYDLAQAHVRGELIIAHAIIEAKVRIYGFEAATKDDTLSLIRRLQELHIPVTIVTEHITYDIKGYFQKYAPEVPFYDAHMYLANVIGKLITT